MLRSRPEQFCKASSEFVAIYNENMVIKLGRLNTYEHDNAVHLATF